ncbi:MAG: hypothetical protein QXK12_03800 [Candidatus Nezhaarchaeales archaeon]
MPAFILAAALIGRILVKRFELEAEVKSKADLALALVKLYGGVQGGLHRKAFTLLSKLTMLHPPVEEKVARLGRMARKADEHAPPTPNEPLIHT